MIRSPFFRVSTCAVMVLRWGCGSSLSPMCVSLDEYWGWAFVFGDFGRTWLDDWGIATGGRGDVCVDVVGK